MSHRTTTAKKRNKRAKRGKYKEIVDAKEKKGFVDLLVDPSHLG
jgi:hypothetical protein